MTLGMVWFPNWLRSNSPGKKISSRKSPKSAYSGTFNVDVDDDDNLDDDDDDNDGDDDADDDQVLVGGGHELAAVVSVTWPHHADVGEALQIVFKTMQIVNNRKTNKKQPQQWENP